MNPSLIILRVVCAALAFGAIGAFEARADQAAICTALTKLAEKEYAAIERSAEATKAREGRYLDSMAIAAKFFFVRITPEYRALIEAAKLGQLSEERLAGELNDAVAAPLRESFDDLPALHWNSRDFTLVVIRWGHHQPMLESCAAGHGCLHYPLFKDLPTRESIDADVRYLEGFPNQTMSEYVRHSLPAQCLKNPEDGPADTKIEGGTAKKVEDGHYPWDEKPPYPLTPALNPAR